MPTSETFATSGTNFVGHSIDNERLHFLAVLGVGAYGVVYLARDRLSNEYVAVKCLLRAGLDRRQRHFQQREIRLHALASGHPSVVTLHQIIEEGDYVFVVLDFCDEGDLFGMITERQRYLGNDKLIKSVFLQIIDAVQHCHSMGIYHRDLKPENILCLRGGEKICLADFGLATSEKQSKDFGCGSTFYLSPECQGGLFEPLESYSTRATDIWSLGVILVNLTCGRNPWRQACGSDETFRAYVHDHDFLRTILPISQETHAILKGVFELEPEKRIDLRTLREKVEKVEKFALTDEELRTAHQAARQAAMEFQQAPVAVSAVPVPTPTPTPAPVSAPSPKRVIASIDEVDEIDDHALDAFAHDHYISRTEAEKQASYRSLSSSSPPSPTWSAVSSTPSQLSDIDDNAYMDSLPGSAHQQFDQEAGTPLLITHDPFDKLSVSRSSSSGRSLPFTPGLEEMAGKVIDYATSASYRCEQYVKSGGLILKKALDLGAFNEESGAEGCFSGEELNVY